jgi:hypothetical protein
LDIVLDEEEAVLNEYLALLQKWAMIYA